MKKKSFWKKLFEKDGKIRDYEVHVTTIYGDWHHHETKILHCPKRNMITRFAGELEELYKGFKLRWDQGYVGFSPSPYAPPFQEGNKGEPIVGEFIRGIYIFPNGVQYAEWINGELCLLDEKGIVISDRYRSIKPLGGPYDVFRTDTTGLYGNPAGYLVAGDGTEIIGYKNIEPCGDNCYKLEDKQSYGFIKFIGIGEELGKKPYIKPTMKL